jgi:peptidoglycan-associated lipoprotein
MKNVFLIGALFLCICAQGQSLSEASSLFDRFEYSKAAEIYSSISRKKSLSQEEYKKMAYSYFAIDEFSKCFPFADSLIKMNEIEPYFYYMHAYTAMALNKFDLAKSSFKKYQALDDEYDVSILLYSCDSIPTWSESKFKGNSPIESNFTKADFNGSKYNLDYIRFQEKGLDSAGNNLPIEKIDEAELLLSKPMIQSIQGESQPIYFNATYDNTAITSFALLAQSNEVIVTISQPLSVLERDKAPHLYKGKFDPLSNTVSDLLPWDYSGYEDSTYCAHATVNTSGNVIVFSKMGKTTQGSDLYITKLENNSWLKPEPISELNSNLDDVYPLFSGDTILSFSSNGRIGYGGLDIFVSHFDGNQFSTTHHIKAPVNSFSDDFNYVFLSEENAIYSSNKFGSAGDDDMYSVAYEIIKEDPAKEEYAKFVESWIDLKVYFDFAKYNLTIDNTRLLEIVDFMKKYPSLSLSIEGHTDSRGTEEYNENLGYFRAEVIKKEFVKIGVDPNQIKVVSKGKSNPLVICDNKICSEEDHALNRVSVLKLVLPQ